MVLVLEQHLLVVEEVQFKESNTDIVTAGGGGGGSTSNNGGNATFQGISTIYVAVGRINNTLAYSFDGTTWIGQGKTIFTGEGRWGYIC
jgi:hypothetical protein